MTNYKVVMLTNILTPYRIPLFNYLAHHGDFDLKVIALAENEANRQWRLMRGLIQFYYQILPGWHGFIWKWELPIHLNRGVIRALKKYKADIIITSGYDSLAYWQAFFYAKLFGKRFILCNESTLLSTTYIKGLVGFLKRFIICRSDAYVAFGKKSKEYLEAFGAKPNRIHVGIDTVDMEFFRTKAQSYRENGRFNREREKLPKFLLLYVGRLAPRKGILQVLSALAELNDPEIGLFIVGNGTQENELKRFCREHHLRNIYFEGFQQQEMLPQYYALADVLIFPSTYDVWGLVVNESLASGLYVLCSNYAGAAYDLIKKGWNGDLFNPYNTEELATLIHVTKERIKEIRDRREAISKYACQKFGIEQEAQAFLEAIQDVVEKSTK